jgi:PAS domain S-box-containing protein
MSHPTNQPTPADPAAAAPAPTATNSGPPLRQRAEAAFRAQAVQSPEDLAVQSPEEAQRTLHKLRVHQIELEMQNNELRQSQAELAAAKDRYLDLYDQAPVGYLTLSEKGPILESNLTAAKLLGVVRGALVKQPLSRFILPADQDICYVFRQQLLATEAPQACELRMVKEGGPLLWARLEGTLVLEEGVPPVSRIVVIDITERKRHEVVMAARLRLLTLAPAHTLAELLRATLDEAEALSGSSIGFYHFLEADQKTLWLQAWSTNTTRNMCRAEGAGTHYPVDQAGVWVDCIRQRQAVIHNDFATVPHRKGMPPGHATVVRELVVPVMRGGQITAILGVGNKPTDYTAEDVKAVSALADLAWGIAENKLVQTELLQRNAELTRFHEAVVGRELRMIELKEQVNDLCRQLGQPPRYVTSEPVSVPVPKPDEASR